MIMQVITDTRVSAQPVDQEDSTSLVQLFHSFNGAQWHNSSGWMDQPVSEWHGIELEEINGYMRVIAIELEENNLSGDAELWLGSILGKLQHLKILNLSNNRLSSSYDTVYFLLEGVTELNDLEVLKLSGNVRLRGTLPPGTGHPGLKVLWFNDTGLYEIHYNEEYQQWLESLEDLKRSGMVEGSPIEPELIHPADQTDDIPLPATLRWEEITRHPEVFWFIGPADLFRVQVAGDEGFDQILVDTLVDGTSVTIGNSLDHEQSYYWRVQAHNEVSTGIWTLASPFTTMKEVVMTVTESSYDGTVFSGFSMMGDDFLVLPVSGDAVYSMDASLQERFSLSVEGELLASGSIAYDSSFYIGSTNSTMYAFNKNGAPLWNAAVGGQISATPAVDSITGTVYIGVENRNVIALDRLSGSSRWSFFADAPVRHSPVVSASRIMLVASSGGTVYGLDLESDQEPPHLWEHDLGADITANLSLGLPGHAYAVMGSNELVSMHFDRQGVDEQWRVEFDGTLSASPVIDAYNHIYIADEVGGITKLDAESGGEIWNISLHNPVSTTPALGDGRLYVADQQGIVYSIDPRQGSVNWQFSFAENPSRSMLYANESLYIGSRGGQVIRVHDPVDEMAGNLKTTGERQITDEAVARSSLWSTDMGNNRRTGVQSQDKIITSARHPDRHELPEEFDLAQNYPNPFNPVTQIRYSVPKPAYVRLEVYNAMGQRLAILVNENKSPGIYEVTFDATGLSSGMYLYRLQTESYSTSKQMLLIK